MTWLLSFSRVFAACTSLFMLLSPAPMVYKIHKDQHSGVMSIVPLAAVLVNSHMWMMYGYLDENYFPVFATFLAGDGFLCLFIAVFYRWTHERRKAHYVFAVAGLAMAAMTTYSLLAGYGYTGQSRQGVVNTAGALSAMTGTVMYVSPLEKIFHVFKYKSAAFVPIYLVCAGALNNTAWILFAMLTGKYIILVPSFFALAGNLFQVVLYFFVYNPKTHPLVLDNEVADATITTSTTTEEIQVVVAAGAPFHSLGGKITMASDDPMEATLHSDASGPFNRRAYQWKYQIPWPAMTVVLQVFRIVAACSSLFMLLSPSPMVYNMHKNRHTGVMSIVPLLAVLVNSNMWMMYGYLDENYVPVFATFVAGDLIALTYVVVFYRWTKDRASVHGVMAIAALVFVATSLYVILGGFGVTGQTRHEVAQVAGIIADVTGMVMYASPLVKIIQVFKYKSAVFIPTHMVCMGSTNNVIWITYSIMDSKWIILIPSFLALCIGVFQMILYFFVYHPSTHPLPADYSEGPDIGAKNLPHMHDAENNLSHLSLTIESPRPCGEEHKNDFVALKSTRALSSAALEAGK